MITPKAYLAQIPNEERVAMTARSTTVGLRHLSVHVGLAVILGVLIGLGVPGWPILLPIQGVMLVFLFTLQHECTHKTPFAQDWLCAVIGHTVGVVILLPFHWFRAFHFAHHRWTNQPGLDPELEGPEIDTWPRWILHVSGLPYWTGMIGVLIRLALGREQQSWLPASAQRRAEREARIYFLVYFCAGVSLFLSPLLLWVWLVPVVLGQPFLRLYLLAEHGDCPKVQNMFQNTRTTFTSRWLRTLAWNMPYHTEHHVWPSVPFHKLPDLHASMKSHLCQTEDGYLAFNRAFLARRLNPEPVRDMPLVKEDGKVK